MNVTTAAVDEESARAITWAFMGREGTKDIPGLVSASSEQHGLLQFPARLPTMADFGKSDEKLPEKTPRNRKGKAKKEEVKEEHSEETQPERKEYDGDDRIINLQWQDYMKMFWMNRSSR